MIGLATTNIIIQKSPDAEDDVTIWTKPRPVIRISLRSTELEIMGARNLLR